MNCYDDSTRRGSDYYSASPDVSLNDLKVQIKTDDQ
jgi:hypothetical protein